MSNGDYTTKELLELLRSDFKTLEGRFDGFEREFRDEFKGMNTAMNSNYVTKAHLESEMKHLKDRYDPFRYGLIYLIMLILTAVLGAILLGVGLEI